MGKKIETDMKVGKPAMTSEETDCTQSWRVVTKNFRDGKKIRPWSADPGAKSNSSGEGKEKEN